MRQQTDQPIIVGMIRFHLAFSRYGGYSGSNNKPYQLLVSIVMKQTNALAIIALCWLTACTPTVQLAAPKEPITINLNVKIEHEIRVKVDKELDDVFANNADLF